VSGAKRNDTNLQVERKMDLVNFLSEAHKNLPVRRKFVSGAQRNDTNFQEEGKEVKEAKEVRKEVKEVVKESWGDEKLRKKIMGSADNLSKLYKMVFPQKVY